MKMKQLQLLRRCSITNIFRTGVWSNSEVIVPCHEKQLVFSKLDQLFLSIPGRRPFYSDRSNVIKLHESLTPDSSVSLRRVGLAQSSSGPLSSYRRLTEEGKLHAGDIHQEEALAALQLLFEEILHKTSAGQPTKLKRMSLWSSWLPSNKQTQPSIKGLYLFGGVGTGKTMLMDMFYGELPDWLSKERIHFHDFMLKVHGKLRSFRGLPNPLKEVANDLSLNIQVLCLDEFMVTDVADAMILNRLFAYLFANEIILVSTSNRHPDNLYENGLQRDLFLPFIALLKSCCVIHQIGSSIDYRRQTLIQQGLYFTGEDASALLKEKLNLLTTGAEGKEETVELVMGRTLNVPFSANGVAYFGFHELCEMPLGAADFIGLVNHFHTVVLDGIPIFGASNRSSAYRFVTLVDVMYEHRAQLVCSAEGRPYELFEKVITISEAPKRSSSRLKSHDEADLLVDDNLGFAKDRTISRLIEMQSVEYQEVNQQKYPR